MISKALLEKFRSGTCTPEDVAQLKAYFEQEEVTELENILQEDWQNTEDIIPTTQAIKHRIWQRLEESTQLERIPVIRHLQPNWKAWRSVAAAILFILATASTYWILQKWNHSETVIVENTTDAALQIALEDGSKIWLSEQSTLQYQKPFAGNKRDIYLKGEAFFEVAKDSIHPFTVYAQGFGTTALGTSFNIRAFADSSDVKVALVTGKVSVSPLRNGKPQTQYGRILTPGKQLRYNIKARTVLVENFDPALTLAWRDGNLVFDNESLSTVLLRLAKHYQVDIQFEKNKLDQCLLNTSFSKKESLKNILTILKFSGHLEFTQRGNRYIVLAGAGCE